VSQIRTQWDRDRSSVLIEGVDHVFAGLPVIDEWIARTRSAFFLSFSVFRAGYRLTVFWSRPFRLAHQFDLQPRVDASKWSSDSSFSAVGIYPRSILAEIPAATCFHPRELSRRFSPWRSSSVSVSVASESNHLVFKEATYSIGKSILTKISANLHQNTRFANVKMLGRDSCVYEVWGKGVPESSSQTA